MLHSSLHSRIGHILDTAHLRWVAVLLPGTEDKLDSLSIELSLSGFQFKVKKNGTEHRPHQSLRSSAQL